MLLLSRWILGEKDGSQGEKEVKIHWFSRELFTPSRTLRHIFVNCSIALNGGLDRLFRSHAELWRVRSEFTPSKKIHLKHVHHSHYTLCECCKTTEEAIAGVDKRGIRTPAFSLVSLLCSIYDGGGGGEDNLRAEPMRILIDWVEEALRLSHTP